MIASLIPESLSVGWAIALTVLSFFTSGFTVAFGIGGGIALITILLQILPPAVVIPLHGIVQAGSNSGRAFAMRESVVWPIVGWFAVGATVGVIAASLIIVTLPGRLLMVLLALFILWSIWAPKFKANNIPVKGFAGVGMLATFLSLFVGATGPVVAAFWNQKKLGRQGQVATHASVMTIVHTLKCVAFGYLGFAFTEWLPLIVAMVVSGYLGTLVGKHVLSKLPEEVFAIGFKWTLTVLALRLFVQGAFGW
ncbi:MAG: sulfite exporter TauE/SafE family protein [Burkholderiaceae bacterium]